MNPRHREYGWPQGLAASIFSQALEVGAGFGNVRKFEILVGFDCVHDDAGKGLFQCSRTAGEKKARDLAVAGLNPILGELEETGSL